MIESFLMEDKCAQIERILEIAVKISQLYDVDALFTEILEGAVSLVGSEGGTIYFHNEKLGRLEFRYVISSQPGVAEKLMKEVRYIPVTEGVAGEVARTKKPKITTQVEKEKSFSGKIDEKSGYRTRSMLTVPMIYYDRQEKRERVVGVIQLVNKISDDGIFTEEDLRILMAFAAQAAVIVQTKVLYDKLKNLYFNTIRSLINAIEARDEYTVGHSERVAYFSTLIAENLGWERRKVENLWVSAYLHDIGKIGISDAILRKKGRLTDEEFAVIRSHPIRGAKILAPIREELGEEIIGGVVHHHERWDGRGYPYGLSGEKIPMFARVIAVADVFDAMASDRPYRPKLPYDKVSAELKRVKGAQLDPEMVDAFFQAEERVLEVSYPELLGKMRR